MAAQTNNHEYETTKQARETYSAAICGVLYPPLCGIVQLTNSAALRIRNWSFTNKIMPSSRKFIELFCASFILLLYFLLSNLWVFDTPFWRYDDPIILYYAITENLGVFLFSSELWQMHLPGFFSPLIPVSFALDYAVAGLDAAAFYYHHFLAVYLTSLLTFIWLRPYIGSTRALLAGLLFLAGIPTFIMSNQLMTRHYIEGLLFVIVFLIFCRKMESSSWRRWIGAFFLFLALMAKEIFVIFLLYPSFTQKNRSFFRQLSMMIPAIISTMVFFIWRTIMIKGVGGYGYPDKSAWDNLLGFLSSMGNVFFGEGWIALCVFASIAFVFFSTIFIYRNRLRLSPFLKIMGGACMMLLVFLPAIVAINNPQREYSHFTYHRYLFISWWAFSCLLMSLPHILAASDAKKVEAMAGINRFRSGIMVFFVLTAIMLLSIQNQKYHSFMASKSSFENLYRFAIGRGAGSILYYPEKDSFWYFDLQLRALANIYMRPRLYLEYKGDYTNEAGRGDYLDWIFDPTCTCFRERIKTK